MEHDLLGRRDVPASAYWGIHTLRAQENFPITGNPIGGDADLVIALGVVKQAAAATNIKLGLIDEPRGAAIISAAEEIRGGLWHEQFVVDRIQGGAGTSTNMNANEVIANRALELLGRDRGEYDHLHPIEHVNRCQSTNDVYPTAIKLALIGQIERLQVSLTALASSFTQRSARFTDVLEVGRTQLQDAVPMTVGQELTAYAVTISEDVERFDEAIRFLQEVNLGATAIGTSINAPAEYPPLVVEELGRMSGRPLTAADDLIEATEDTGVFVLLSGILKRTAVKLSKICNDLRLLYPGRRPDSASWCSHLCRPVRRSCPARSIP